VCSTRLMQEGIKNEGGSIQLSLGYCLMKGLSLPVLWQSWKMVGSIEFWVEQGKDDKR
jgi:hypothetical protein